MADKRFTRAEISSRNTKQDAVFIVHNHVYDVSAFLDEHPGGHEVLVRVAGKDASEDFDDIGHSLDAKELMKKYRIGELVEEEKTKEERRPLWTNVNDAQAETGGFASSWQMPVLLGVVATLLYLYLFG